MKTFVNMLPQSYRRQNLVRLRLVRWAPVWLLVLAGAAPAYWAEHTKYEAELVTTRAKEGRYAAVEKLSAELSSIRRQLTDLQKQEAVAAELVNSQPILSLVGVVSRSARRCGGKLRVDKFSMVPVGGSADRSSARQTSVVAARRQLVLEGKSLDNLAIPKFVAHLRETGVFEKVELKGAKKGPSDGDSTHSYVVECTF